MFFGIFASAALLALLVGMTVSCGSSSDDGGGGGNGSSSLFASDAVICCDGAEAKEGFDMEPNKTYHFYIGKKSNGQSYNYSSIHWSVEMNNIEHVYFEYGSALLKITPTEDGGADVRVIGKCGTPTTKIYAEDVNGGLRELSVSVPHFDYFISDIYYYDPADDPYNNSGYATSGYDTGGYATSGYDTDGYDTDAPSTDGYATSGYDSSTPSTGGYTTSQYARRQRNIENW